MLAIKKILILVLTAVLLLPGCATTSVRGTGNEKYQTEAETPDTREAVTEIAPTRIVYLHPTKEEIPPHYFKVRVPGVKSVLYVFSDENGESQFRVYGRLADEERRGFFPVVLLPDTGLLYTMKLEGRDIVDVSEDKPGTPIRRGDAVPPPDKVLSHWLPADDGGHLYHIRDKNGEYQFRQWAKLGDHEDFYPANDRGILLRGGIPDAVKVRDKWVAVRIMNPMTFVYAGLEEDETEEIIISVPQTDESDPYAPETEATYDPPKTEAPSTESPGTQPPKTEPPVTEPPETEPPVTEPPETEPPVTEPPVTEPPETEPPSEDEAQESEIEEP